MDRLAAVRPSGQCKWRLPLYMDDRLMLFQSSYSSSITTIGDEIVSQVFYNALECIFHTVLQSRHGSKDDIDDMIPQCYASFVSASPFFFVAAIQEDSHHDSCLLLQTRRGVRRRRLGCPLSRRRILVMMSYRRSPSYHRRLHDLTAGGIRWKGAQVGVATTATAGGPSGPQSFVLPPRDRLTRVFLSLGR